MAANKPNIETYRQLVTLADGARILLRPLTTADGEALVKLYAAAQPEDVRPLRDDVTNSEVVRTWIQDLDYARVLPLLALLNERVVGNATLHRRTSPYQHVGEVRIFLAKDFRGRGLGTDMLKTLIEMSRKEGLHWLQAEVFASQPKVIRAFEGLGFKRQCVFEDYFMLADGQTEDVVILLMRLLKRTDEF
jgi:RimJ/RimL family protein N-acetyltransferase